VVKGANGTTGTALVEAYTTGLPPVAALAGGEGLARVFCESTILLSEQAGVIYPNRPVVAAADDRGYRKENGGASSCRSASRTLAG
jgi:hypothetical protein